MFSFACETFNLEEVIMCSLSINKTECNILTKLMTQPLTIKQVSTIMKLERSSVQKNIKKLVEKELLIRKQINLSKGGYKFVYTAKNKTEIKNKVFNSLNDWMLTARKEINTW